MVRRPAFETLSDIVDACESHGGTVQSVTATTADGGVSVRLVVDHRLETATADTFTPESANLTEDGELRVRFRAPSLESLLPSATPITAEQTATVAVTDVGALRCTHEFTLETADTDTAVDADGASSTETDVIESNAGGSAVVEGSESGDVGSEPATNRDGGAATAGTDLQAIRDESVPPYEDTEYLQALYDSCETFAEMSERIEMDVVSETVRRYMVDAGIHAPDSYGVDDTADDEPGRDGHSNPSAHGESEPPDDQLVADGLGLPDDVGVADLVEAVVDAATVYEVTRSLGTDQARTRELLNQLGLLGDVMHRVADDPRGLTREEVRDHVRRYGSS